MNAMPVTDSEVVSLKHHLEVRCDERTKQFTIHIQRLEERMGALEKSVEDKFGALERITSTVAGTMDQRLQSMNEFRDALRDQASKFVTRTEMDTEYKGIEADLRTLREFRAALENKASHNAVMASFVFAALGVFIGVINIIMRMAGK